MMMSLGFIATCKPRHSYSRTWMSESFETRLSTLGQRLRNYEANFPGEPDDNLESGQNSAADSDEEEDAKKRNFLAIFRDTCTLIREAEAAEAPDLTTLVDSADKIFNEGVEFAYGASDLFDFMPSWAHDNQASQPLIKDKNEVPGREWDTTRSDLRPIKTISPAYDFMLKMAAIFSKRGKGKPKIGKPDKLNIIPLILTRPPDPSFMPDPWAASMKRHPKSTPLARFRPELPTLTPIPANHFAMSVYDARCEVSSVRIIPPIRLQLSGGSSCLAMIGACGHKDRAPGLEYFLLDKKDDKNTGFMVNRFVKVGLEDVARHMAVDESRQLIFVGDDNRVKSYAWGIPGSKYHKNPLPTHTFKSAGARGPITILPNGAIIRAGNGSADVWDIHGLDTHGKSGHKRIGKKVNVEDTWRDEDEEIEPSSGTPPSSQIKFVDQPTLAPYISQPLIQSPSAVLYAEFARESGNCGCTTIDLEHGGKTVARYLGHGATVTHFSVSADDPRMFLTACDDGFARLFDVRRCLPVLTFDACGQTEFCKAAVLGHPGGIPS
jgi:hypothetical protein